MGATWPKKDAKGADPSNPPKNNPPPDTKPKPKFEYLWGQMGGTVNVECEILEAFDNKLRIKFWDDIAEDWEIRVVKRGEVNKVRITTKDIIQEVSPSGVPMDGAVVFLFDTLLKAGILTEREIRKKFAQIVEEYDETT